jgi:hypothetical protein
VPDLRRVQGRQGARRRRRVVLAQGRLELSGGVRTDGSFTRVDRTGTITEETFQRGVPEWKALSTLDWTRDRWGGSFAQRYVHDMVQAAENEHSSRTYADVNVRYKVPFSENALAAVLGINNIFDDNPSTCDSCNVIGMAPVAHDLPGTVVYGRFVLNVLGQ